MEETSSAGHINLDNVYTEMTASCVRALLKKGSYKYSPLWATNWLDVPDL